MLMIPARLVRSESFWAVVKVRSPHTGPGISYIISRPKRTRGDAHLALLRGRAVVHRGRARHDGPRRGPESLKTGPF